MVINKATHGDEVSVALFITMVLLPPQKHGGRGQCGFIYNHGFIASTKTRRRGQCGFIYNHGFIASTKTRRTRSVWLYL